MLHHALMSAYELPASVPDLPTTNLAHWFDFSDSGSITITSGEISTIADKITAGTLNRKGPGNGPKISSINGLQAAIFDGGDVLGGAILDSYFQGTDVPYTIALVVENSNSAQQFFVTRQTTSSSDYYAYGVNNSAGNYFARKRDASNVGGYVHAGPTSSSPHILTFVSDGTTVYIYIDGALVNSGAENYGAMTNVTRLNIGAFWNGGVSIAAGTIGKIGEVADYKAELTGTDLSNLHEHLSAKWLIAI